MKKIALITMLFTLALGIKAQELSKIELNKPDQKRGTTVMEALSKRQSIREYNEKELSRQDLSDLLWAAVGVNRPESGKRTAPTAMNKQEIEVYAIFPEGAFLYDAKNHVLLPVAKGDFRDVLAMQQSFVKSAPVCLLIVADISKFDGNNNEQKLATASIDAGIVSQNISIFCAGTNMATVPRGWMDKDGIKKALNLKDSQIPVLNHPVGYAK